MALTDGLIAYWKLDESSGNAVDATGNGYTLTNNNSVSYAPAKINNGADYGVSNTNKFLSINSTLGFTPGVVNRTISGWFKAKSQPSTNSLFNLIFQQLLTNQGGSGTRYFLRVYYRDDGGTKQLFCFLNNTTYNVTLTTDVWYYITVTTDISNNLQIFLNGTLVASSNGTDSSAHGSSEINVFSLGVSRYTNSNLNEIASFAFDEVGIWNRVLSGSEITQLDNGGAGNQYPFLSFNPAIARRRILIG